MLPCGCRQGILWVPSNDGQQKEASHGMGRGGRNQGHPGETPLERGGGSISGFGLSGEREVSIELRPGVWAAALTDVAVVSAGAGGEEGRDELSSGWTPGSGTPRS